jgi:hypothetical protein
MMKYTNSTVWVWVRYALKYAHIKHDKKKMFSTTEEIFGGCKWHILRPRFVTTLPSCSISFTVVWWVNSFTTIQYPLVMWRNLQNKTKTRPIICSNYRRKNLWALIWLLTNLLNQGKNTTYSPVKNRNSYATRFSLMACAVMCEGMQNCI